MKRILVALSILLILSILITSCGGPSVNGLSEKASNKDVIEALNIIGESGYIQFTPPVKGEKAVAIKGNELIINIKTDAADKYGLNKDSRDVLKIISNAKNIPSRIKLVHLGPITDKNDNERLGKYMVTTINRSGFRNINWDNFATEDLPNVADSYWIHPDFR